MRVLVTGASDQLGYDGSGSEHKGLGWKQIDINDVCTVDSCLVDYRPDAEYTAVDQVKSMKVSCLMADNPIIGGENSTSAERQQSSQQRIVFLDCVGLVDLPECNGTLSCYIRGELS